MRRPPARSRRSWERPLLALLACLDAAGVLVGSYVALALGRGGAPVAVAQVHPSVPYWVGTALVMVAWVSVLGLGRTYETRVLGAGSDEYRRIIASAVRILAVLGAVAFFGHVTLGRSWVAVVSPVMVAWSLFAHWGARQGVHRARRAGQWQQPTVVVGTEAHVRSLVDHLRRHPHHGYDVVGLCTGGADAELVIGDRAIPVVAGPGELVDWLGNSLARAVIVADASVLGAGALRRFAWRLEGLGVDLMVAPSITEVAGPRVAVRPVEGLPLLHLDEPRLDGVTRFIKGAAERMSALLALMVLSPLLLAVALAVRVTSRGPVFYRHTRIGRAGEPFEMLKFRTMVDGAEAMKRALAAHNEHGDQPLFKMRFDPRVTRVGRVLRRLSLDELPQLVHVVTGRMAVVGPRPPTPDEVARYDDDAWRRLLVRPGITGLWQVSGRSTLPWTETLRLDLYYIDNWSLSLDLVIALKTLDAVVRGRGAY